MHDNFMRLGPPPFDEADRAFAAKIQATLTEEDIAAALPPPRHDGGAGTVLCDASCRWMRAAGVSARPMSAM